MSLYGLLVRQDVNAQKLLDMLNEVYPFHPPRYRDCTIERNKICVLTRTGGESNREDYEEANEAMKAHPLFVRDRDVLSDCTYAEWFFHFPAEHREELRAIAQQERAERRKERAERRKQSRSVSNDTSESDE